MRLVTFKANRNAPVPIAGALVDGWLIDLYHGQLLARERFPECVGEILGDPERFPQSHLETLARGTAFRIGLEALIDGLMDHFDKHLTYRDQPIFYPLEEAELIAPLPNPRSVRDFYSFEEHVRTARAARGLEMVPEWYEAPVFYFTNHQQVSGPEDTIEIPRGSSELDFELEIAAYIGKQGRNIPPELAVHYIAGYSLMNDWSARDLQRREMKVGLGPAKGKDFALTLGPAIVTPDELYDRQRGKGYDLAARVRLNGEELAEANWADIHWSFAEMIARASENVTLYPGDVIGSGCLPGCSLLELRQKRSGLDWLRPGDVVELEVERLGRLRNTVQAAPSEDGFETESRLAGIVLELPKRED